MDTIETFITDHRKSFFTAINDAVFTCENGIVINQVEWIEKLVHSLISIREKKGNIYFIGNGASASMASHFSADLTKNSELPSFTLTDSALMTCFANDYSYATAYKEMLKRYLRAEDGIVAISSSGSSPNILEAMGYGKEIVPDKIFTFSGFHQNNFLRTMGALNVWIPSLNYGLVESAHSYFLHVVVDFLFEKDKNKISQ